MPLSAAAPAPTAEGAARLSGLEREHLREALEAQLVRGHLTHLARGFGYLSLGPGLLLCGPAFGGRVPGLTFPAALLFLAASGLHLVLRTLASREGRRLPRRDSASLVHEAPAPWWRPLETGVLGVTALAGAVLATEAVLPGVLPRPAVVRAGALWLGAAVAAAACFLAETRYSSRRR